MKKLVSLALALALVLALTVCPVSAAGKAVTVDVANYPIALNGQIMDNAYAAYPLILYNQITYFPMTYYDCRFMGVTTDWNQSTQTLKIDATGVSEGYHPTTQTAKNPSSATATVADYNIIINGSAIDNARETYPLLTFREVTYFPMTWRFCVDEFAWQYNYTNETGLAIVSDETVVAAPAVNPVPSGSISVTQTKSGDDYKVSISRLPVSVSDLKAFDLTNEYISAAAVFCTLARFENDFEGALEMLDYVMGPESPGSHDRSFLRDQIGQYPYVMRSYFEGATVANDYTPTAYVLTFRENSYSRQSTNSGYTTVTLYSPSSGADSPRPVTLRLKPSTGEWFLFSDSFMGVMSGIRKPASLDPWN